MVYVWLEQQLRRVEIGNQKRAPKLRIQWTCKEVLNVTFGKAVLLLKSEAQNM